MVQVLPAEGNIKKNPEGYGAMTLMVWGDQPADQLAWNHVSARQEEEDMGNARGHEMTLAGGWEVLPLHERRVSRLSCFDLLIAR